MDIHCQTIWYQIFLRAGCFAKWMRDTHRIDTDTLPTYRHTFADVRIVDAKMYPSKYLDDFRKHFNEVWIATKAKKYYQDKDPTALPYLDKIISMLPVPNKKN